MGVKLAHHKCAMPLPGRDPLFRAEPHLAPSALAALLVLFAACGQPDVAAPGSGPGVPGVNANLASDPAPEFHVAPTGSPSGDGSFANPWDLATALSGPATVTPGSTIWLHEGTYVPATP